MQRSASRAIFHVVINSCAGRWLSRLINKPYRAYKYQPVPRIFRSDGECRVNVSDDSRARSFSFPEMIYAIDAKDEWWKVYDNLINETYSARAEARWEFFISTVIHGEFSFRIQLQL